ncbi:3'-5' exonuclease-like [Andrographis paniculata]|uniref:3'-5' exonuclease-like n=1 Tax=Andrographis paniculata TaxID=175694 RepID=UPI0021E719DF|nr:3'-5' exonuclease-like [Andrographis paniculata]
MANNNPPLRIFNHQLPYPTYNTYTVYFYEDSVHTTLTNNRRIVTEWITNVERSYESRRRRRSVVGLEMEWRHSYISEHNPVATVQLCIGQRCLIFQLLHCSLIPNIFWNFLVNPNYKFVGIGIRSNLEKLEYDYDVELNVNSVDLRHLAAIECEMNDLRFAGMTTLARVVLSKEVNRPRRVTMSRWDSESLTPLQVQFACISAYVSAKIGLALNADT